MASRPVRNEIHVCALRLSTEWTNALHWRGVLNDEERTRADRFVFEKDRRAFTITRGVLRTLLGRYLEAPPAALTIATNPFGKPGVTAVQTGGALSFNVSHSGDYALLAFGAGTPLGVDIEEIRSTNAIEDLARTVLSPREHTQFLQLSTHDRLPAFFRAWTRKEAFVKGVGKGLSIPFETVGTAGEPGWSICDLDVDPGYAAAVAVQTTAIDLRVWNW